MHRLGATGLARRLGLERLERLERAPELGHRGAAIAQERLERARAVAVADQREAWAGVAIAALLEQLDLQAIGARETPRGKRDPTREHGLQRTDGRQLVDHGRLECSELGGVLLRQHYELLRAQAVLQCIPRRSGLAFFGPRPA
jgi:hypothetical protein